MKYKKITKNDATFLTEIFSVEEYELYFAENRTSVEEWCDRMGFFDGKESLVIMDDSDCPVGWLMYNIVDRICNIDIIVFKNQERHKGYGTKVIEDIVLQNKEKIDSVQLDVQKRNTVALAFYKHIGFEIIGEDWQSVRGGELEYNNLRFAINQ